MKKTFTNRQLGGFVGCFITAGMHALSILTVSALWSEREVIPCLILIFYLATCIEVGLGWMYIRHNGGDRMTWSSVIVAFGIVAVLSVYVLLALLDRPSDAVKIVGLNIIVGFVPILACSVFLHSSLVLLLRRTDWGLYLSQVFCIATIVHSGYWLAEISASV